MIVRTIFYSLLVVSSTAKKPVVIASNHGLSSSNPPKLVEWCLYSTPLEPFFKDNRDFVGWFFPAF